jgi:hypothetical protein
MSRSAFLKVIVCVGNDSRDTLANALDLNVIRFLVGCYANSLAVDVKLCPLDTFISVKSQVLTILLEVV